jgi:hypothetical protein
MALILKIRITGGCLVFTGMCSYYQSHRLLLDSYMVFNGFLASIFFAYFKKQWRFLRIMSAFNMSSFKLELGAPCHGFVKIWHNNASVNSTRH